MREKRANAIAAIYAALAVGVVAFLAVSYLDTRSRSLAHQDAFERGPEIAKSEVAAVPLETRYVPPAPITYPFY
ncbi:hypothetical protein BH09SUM1_BH09SUM1_08120 [soil metagenome]